MFLSAFWVSFLLFLVCPSQAIAQVRAGGLGTRVNGSAYGSCTAGRCAVNGGIQAGSNLFQRFSQFDTRGRITRVSLDTQGKANVIVGITHPAGTFLDKSLQLSAPTNLFWLSPGGIWLGSGATVVNATNLMLSTSRGLKLMDGGFFDALQTTAQQAANLTGGPMASLSDLELPGKAPIVLAGGLITVERNLLMDARGGRISSPPGANASVSAGQTVRIVGHSIDLNDITITAAGSGARGAVEIGTTSSSDPSDPDVIRLKGVTLKGQDLSLAAATIVIDQSRFEAFNGRVELFSRRPPPGDADVPQGLTIRRSVIEGGNAAPQISLISSGGIQAEDSRFSASGLLALQARDRITFLSSTAFTDAAVFDAAAIDLVQASITAGRDAEAGTIAVQTPGGASRLEATILEGNRLQISAGNLSIEGSHLLGRAGSIQLQTTNPTGSANALNLSNSKVAAGAIGVSSSGDLRLKNSTLEASASQVGGSGGQISLDTKGKLEVEASVVSSRSDPAMPAGGIVLQSQDGGSSARIKVISSLLRAEGGGPAGAINLFTAGAIELIDSELLAAYTGRVVLSSANPPASGDQGSLRIDGVRITGADLSLSSGEVWLTNSTLEAPNGWIQLQTTNQDSFPNTITLTNSRLDVGIHSLEDLSRPVANSPLPEQIPGDDQQAARYRSTPHIGLFANGAIRLDAATLFATQDVSSLRSQGTAQELDLRYLPDFSIVFLDAATGIDLSSSSIHADASDSLAGRIFLSAKGTDAKGGVRIADTTISASHGMGRAKIVIDSAAGIDLVQGSVLEAISDRFPVLNGSAFGTAVDADGLIVQLPYNFLSSEILLINRSEQQPLVVENATISSNQSRGGGPLGSEDYRLKPDDPFGTFRGFNTFNLGYNQTGGVIQAYSNAAMRISNSKLDVSSFDPATKTLDSIGGSMYLITTNAKSPKELDINNSFLNARTGDDFDASHFGDVYNNAWQNGSAGQIYVLGSTAVTMADTSIDASLKGALGAGGLAPPLVVIVSAQEAGISFSHSTPDSNRIDVRMSSNDPSTMDQGIVNIFPAPAAQSSLPWILPGSSYDAGYYGFETLIEALDQLQIVRSDGFRLFLGDAYNAGSPPPLAGIPPLLLSSQLPSGTAVPFTPASPSVAPLAALALTGNPIRPINPLTSAAPASLALNLEPKDAAAQFLEAQRRSLEDTAQRLGLPAGSGRLRTITDLQNRLRQVEATGGAAASPWNGSSPYKPAILHLQRRDSPSGEARIQAILLPPHGEPISRTIELPAATLNRLIQGFQLQLSRRESLDPASPSDPGSTLAKLLIDPLLPDLRQRSITALLLEVDRGLQAIPFSALPTDRGPLGEAFALTITPSLGLSNLDPSRSESPERSGSMLLAGTSEFPNQLVALPMVRQELQALAADHPATLLIDANFSAAALRLQALKPTIHRLHIATHADFLPGQRGSGWLYTASGPLSLADLGSSLRSRSGTEPIDLISISACTTSLGDEQSELGLVGMALQSGARSGLGTLWQVDDAAAAAFFIQFYRYLKLGITKDLALQATRQAFLHGSVHLVGDRLVGPDPRFPNSEALLIRGLDQEERVLYANGLSHPYYWAGMILSGSPW